MACGRTWGEILFRSKVAFVFAKRGRVHAGRDRSTLSGHRPRNGTWGSQDARSTARLWRRLSASPTRRSSETSSGCTGQSRPHFRQHHAMITAVPWMVVSAVTQPTAAQKTHRAGTENRSCCDMGIGSRKVTTRPSRKTVRTIPYAQWVRQGGADTVEFAMRAVLPTRTRTAKTVSCVNSRSALCLIIADPARPSTQRATCQNSMSPKRNSSSASRAHSRW
jgi:hypothetical protein